MPHLCHCHPPRGTLVQGTAFLRVPSILSDQNQGGAVVRTQRESVDIPGSRTVHSVEVILVLTDVSARYSEHFSPYRGARLGGEYNTAADTTDGETEAQKGQACIWLRIVQ